MCLACVRAFAIYKSLLPLHLTGDCQACGTLLSLTRLVGLGLGLADLLPSFPPPPDLIFVWLFLLVFSSTLLFVLLYLRAASFGLGFVASALCYCPVIYIGRSSECSSGVNTEQSTLAIALTGYFSLLLLCGVFWPSRTV